MEAQSVVSDRTTADRIEETCDRLKYMLVAKNQSYGDSVLHPIQVFGKGKATDLIGARIDDKLSRIRNAPGAFNEDAVEDLMGYLVMWRIASDMEREGVKG